MWIGGAGVARGYINRPELTAERFVSDLLPEFGPMRWYRTGDLVRQLPSGEFDYLGRLDQQVKLRGFRIELGEIEAALAAHPAITAAATELRQPGSPAQAHLAAYVTLAEPAGLTGDDLREWLAARLPGYMVPATFAVLADLPTTSNGKLDRNALGHASATPLPSRTGRPGPHTPTEHKLQSIWAEVLRIPEVGRDDNFFSIGGDSLLALPLVARLSRDMGTEIYIATLFDNPTVVELARWIDSQTGSAGS